MPLQGNLRDFSTTQLLNLINLAGKTGTLSIFEGLKTNEKDAMGRPKMAPGAERARVSFKTGKLIESLEPVYGFSHRTEWAALVLFNWESNDLVPEPENDNWVGK